MRALRRILAVAVIALALLGSAAMASQDTVMIIPVQGQNYVVALHASQLNAPGQAVYVANYPTGAADNQLYLDPAVYGAGNEIRVMSLDEAGFAVPALCTFKGWALAADAEATLQPEEITAMTNEGLVLFGVWDTDAVFIEDHPIPLAGPETAVPDGAMYTVTFLDGAGATLYAVQVAGGSPVDKPLGTPAMPGSVFSGWEDENGEAYAFTTPVYADLTLRAAFDKNESAR